MERKFVNETKHKIDEFATLIVRWYIPVVIEYKTREEVLSDCTLYGEIQIQESGEDYKSFLNIGSIDIMFGWNYDVEINYDDFKLSWREEIGSELTIEQTKASSINKIANFLKVYYYD